MIDGETLDQLDPLLLHKLRLGACVLLFRNNALSFANLGEVLSAADGNFGAQLTNLEKEGYVSITKEFIDRKPVAWYALTKQGHVELMAHLEAPQRLIETHYSEPN